MLQLYRIKLIINQIKQILIKKSWCSCFLSILQAAIYRRVLVNAVDVNGKFKLNAVSSDALKIQRGDGILIYDAFELSFNNVDKPSISRINNVEILQSINNSVAVNVYSKSEIDIGLNLQSYKIDNYPKTEVTVAL